MICVYSKEFIDNPGRLKCDYLKKFRESLANKYGIEGFEYKPCDSTGRCIGVCAACEQEVVELSRELIKKRHQGGFVLPPASLNLTPFDLPKAVYTPYDLSSYTIYGDPTLPSLSVFGIERLSINKNGNGIVNLVGLSNCPLNCKYCINKEELKSKSYRLGAFELFDILSKDSLYFEHSNGGVCFGGGEPLLQIDSIISFIKFVKSQGYNWRFGLETSFNVNIGFTDTFKEKLSYFDYIIVDVKDLDNDIYLNYTGQPYTLLLANLIQLLTVPNIEKHIRVPLIPNYNNDKNISNTVKILLDMGYSFKDLEYLEYHKVIDAPIDLPIMMGQIVREPVKPVEKPIPPLSGKVVRPIKPVEPVEKPIPPLSGKVVRPPSKESKPNKFDILKEQLNSSKNNKSDT